MKIAAVHCKESDVIYWLRHHIKTPFSIPPTSDEWHSILNDISDDHFHSVWGCMSADLKSYDEFLDFVQRKDKVLIAFDQIDSPSKVAEILDFAYSVASRNTNNEHARYNEVVGLLGRSTLHYGSFYCVLKNQISAMYPDDRSALFGIFTVGFLTILVPLGLVVTGSSPMRSLFGVLAIFLGCLLFAVRFASPLSPHNDASKASIGRKILLKSLEELYRIGNKDGREKA